MDSVLNEVLISIAYGNNVAIFLALVIDTMCSVKKGSIVVKQIFMPHCFV